MNRSTCLDDVQVQRSAEFGGIVRAVSWKRFGGSSEKLSGVFGVPVSRQRIDDSGFSI